MGDPTQRVLSYGDVLLRQSDVALLDGPHFLNDQLIEFYFGYLSNHNVQHSDSSADEQIQPSPLLLVGPTLTFWLLHCPDFEGLKATIDPLNLLQREMVIFALNNNEDVEAAEGGSHWTLLMFNRQRNSFEHFDSLCGTNNKQARELMKIIKPFMARSTITSRQGTSVPRISLNSFRGRQIVASNSGARFIEQPTPQQENSYDCGVYVMAIAQVLCNAFQEGKRSRSRSSDYAALVRNFGSQTIVKKMRNSTMELIFALSAGKEV